MERAWGSPDIVADHLAAVHRLVSEGLAQPAPLTEVLVRLKRAVGASVAVVDRGGRTLAATATLPITAIHAALDVTGPAVQPVDVSGWRGVAAAVADTSTGDAVADDRFGWLLAVSRREEFPDARDAAAVRVAVSIVEMARRIEGIERMQERSVRAALVEQAIALRPPSGDPELTARMASFGLRFGEELRVVVARPAGDRPRRPSSTDVLAAALSRSLRSAGVIEFTATRDDHVVVLAQCSAATVRRSLAGDGLADRLDVGVGRSIGDVGEIAASYADAVLAIRAAGPRGRPRRFAAYEDFDLATRLFADVGLERMTAWADELLRPLDGKELLIDALRAYFAHHQDVKAAAGALFIHHNSMRYRLARIAQVLKVDLHDPSAIASIHLALTALDLADAPTQRERGAPAPVPHPADEAAADVATFRDPAAGEWGVAFGPEA